MGNQNEKLNSCLLCDVPITKSNNSNEHLIPNSIGGRKKIKGILCIPCNSKSGNTWDASLAKELQPLCLFFKISRERGKVQPLKVEASKQQLMLHSDGHFELVKPEHEIKEVNGKIQINISARTMREAKQKVHGLKKRYPNIDEKKFIESLKVNTSHTNEIIKLESSFGRIGNATKSLTKSLLALAKKNNISLVYLQNAINYLKDNAFNPFFGLYYEKDLILNRPKGKVLHCIALKSLQNGLLLGYVELFSIQRIIFCLSESYRGPPISDMYAVDPVSGVELNLELDVSLTEKDLPELYRCEKVSEDSINAVTDAPMKLAMENNFRAAFGRVCSSAIDDAFKYCGVKENEILSEEQKNIVFKIVVERISPFLARHIIFN